MKQPVWDFIRKKIAHGIVHIFRVCAVLMGIFLFNWNGSVLTANATGTDATLLTGDWVRIVSITPNHYDNYSDPVTFTATIDYSLSSREEGIVYLGFNTDDAHYYEVGLEESDHIVVKKGLGRVVLSQTVTPVNWDQPASYALQYLNVYSNSVVTDFKVYANISPYPHDIPWTPLAIDEHVVTSLPEEEQKVEIMFGGKDTKEADLSAERFDTDLENILSKTASTKYDPQLAHMLIGLCNSVHNKTAMDRSFRSLGFTDMDIDLDLDDKQHIGYGLAKKTLDDGSTLVLIVGRGSEDGDEWASNVDIQKTSERLHEGFDEAERDLKGRLDAFLGTESYYDLTYVLTGHSRGAAAVNILAAKLADAGVPQDRIYAYTFACPDVGKLSKDQINAYPMIFNIGNVNDWVTWVPGLIEGPDADGKTWDKFGKSYWFAPDWNDLENIDAKSDMFVNIFTLHSQNVYLDFLREERELDRYKDRSETDSVIRAAVQERRKREMAKMSLVNRSFLPLRN